MSDETAIVKLDEQKAALVKARLESFLQPVGDDSAPAERPPQAPYVGFRGAKSNKNIDALNAAGITVARNGSGTFYLMDPPTPIKVDPFRLHLIQYYRAYTVQDDAGKITDATFKNDKDLFGLGFREHIFGVVLVVLPTYPGFVAATLQLRGAQCNALKSTIQMLGTRETPGFLAYQGDQLKYALKARGATWEPAADVLIPGGRVVTTIYSEAELPKNGGKQPFNQGYGSAAPIDKDHAAKLNKWLEAFGGSLAHVAAINDDRFAKVRQKVFDQEGAEGVIDTGTDVVAE